MDLNNLVNLGTQALLANQGNAASNKNSDKKDDLTNTLLSLGSQFLSSDKQSQSQKTEQPSQQQPQQGSQQQESQKSSGGDFGSILAMGSQFLASQQQSQQSQQSQKSSSSDLGSLLSLGSQMLSGQQQQQPQQAQSSGKKEEKNDIKDALTSAFKKFTNKESSGVDEKQAEKAEQAVYGNGDSSNVKSNEVGAAAALHVFKSFMSGKEEKEVKKDEGLVAKLISMVLSEAMKLFSQRQSSGVKDDKQEMLNGASSMVLKLLLKQQLQGNNSSGSGGLDIGKALDLAKKFL